VRYKKIIVFIYILFLLLLLFGCANLTANLTKISSVNIKKKLPIVSVFLSLKDNNNYKVVVNLKDIEILSNSGIWYYLGNKSIELNTSFINSGQKLLAQIHLPEGSYSRIRFKIISAVIYKSNKPVKLTIKKSEILIPILGNLNLSSKDSKCIFITWDVDSSIKRQNQFYMGVQCQSQSVPLRTELLYVACPKIDTVFIIRTDTNKVCGSFGVTGSPSYIGLDENSNDLYILTTKDNFIKVYNVNSYQLVDQISIPFTVQARYMIFDKKDNYIFVLDPNSNSIARIDLSSGSVIVKDYIGYRPNFGIYLNIINTLAISSQLSQAVYFINPDSLTIVKTISTTNSPCGLLLWGDLLYITNSNSNSISVYNINSNNMVMHFNVGLNPVRLYAGVNEIFVSNYASNNVAVLLPNQMGVVQKINVGQGPVDMACSHSRHWLYVACHIDKEITVIDPSSSRVIRHIYLASMPLGLSVLQ